MKALSILLAATAAAMPAFAAEPADSVSSHGLHFSRVSSEIKEILHRGRPAEKQQVPVPHFAIHSSNNDFVMAIGGVINPIMGVDMGNNLYKQGSGIDFTTSAIPVPATAGHKGDFFINPLQGNLTLQVVGLAGTANEISGFIKVGTVGGDSHAIKLKTATLSWRGITAGLKHTLMADADASQPPTIDPEGPNGMLCTTVYEVGYTTPEFGGGFRAAIGIDMPTFYSSNGYYRGHDYPDFDGEQVADHASAEQMIPDVPAWIEYTFSPGNRVRFSAMLRNFAYRDLVASTTRHKAGWGVMLSGNAAPASALSINYQLAYGRGIGCYLQDIAGLPLSFVPDDSRPGRMSATPMLGATLGASWNVSERWQVNAVASYSRLWDVRSYAEALDASQNYRHATYVAVNAFYNITSYLQWGIEYLWGRRTTWNIGHASDSRLQTQLAFTF